jgi:hypothetical protein
MHKNRDKFKSESEQNSIMQTFEEPQCKTCKTNMVMIGNWANKEEDFALYQCPKCKTVEMKVLDL